MIFSRFRIWLAALLLLALVGCGGGGTGGAPVLGGGSGGGGGNSDVADLQVKFSAASVDNTGTQHIKATVTAVNSNGQGVKDVPLTLKVDKNATFSVSSLSGSTTGADGTVTADVTIGNDYSIRTVTMTASTGALPARSASFQVTGSRQAASDLTLTAPLTIQNSLANTVVVTATAVDANRNALPNIPITFAVDAGATFVPSGTVTGANGTLSGTLSIGADQSSRSIEVTATSGTVTKKLKVAVVGAKLTASNFSSTVGVGKVNAITYLLVDNTGAKMAGYPISVKAAEQDDLVGKVTDADGQYLYTYTAAKVPGNLTIDAVAGGVPQSLTVQVTDVVKIPPAVPPITSPSVSGSPNVVAVNQPGITPTNKVEIRALFLGANNAPVKNVRVWFDLDGDKQSIGGALESRAAKILLYSDANGVARTTYAPGSRFSPKDGVTVRACWDLVDFAIPDDGGACPNSVRTTLTVISESLSVSIGTNGTISFGTSLLTYTKRFAVQVVDSSGQAKSGVQISSSIDLLTYYKGHWEAGASNWVQGGLGNSYPAFYPLSDPPLADRNPANPPLRPWPNPLPVTFALHQGPETATTTWFAGNITACDNEDLNRNGVAEIFLDKYYPGKDEKGDPIKDRDGKLVLIPEDQNGSGGLSPQRPQLDPRKADVTIAVEGNSTTDANGIVVVKIEYPQNIASWVRFNILVSASGVAGTEGRANYEGILPVLASAVTTLTSDPPFKISPYGVQTSATYLRGNPEGQTGWLCTNPN